MISLIPNLYLNIQPHQGHPTNLSNNTIHEPQRRTRMSPINQMLTSGINTLIEHLTAHVLPYPIPAFFLSGTFNALIPKQMVS